MAAAPYPWCLPHPQEAAGCCSRSMVCSGAALLLGVHTGERSCEKMVTEIPGGWQSSCGMTQGAASTRNVACIKCKCQVLGLFHTLVLKKVNIGNCSSTISDLCVEQENLWTSTHTLLLSETHHVSFKKHLALRYSQADTNTWGEFSGLAVLAAFS